MKPGRTLVGLAALMALSLWTLAQEADQEAAEAPPPRAAEQSEPSRPPPSADIFIPSEELAADEEVTFPVDI